MTKIRQGLTAYQLKILALIIMTIDHVAIYLWNIPYIESVHVLLRLIGRISAPLFLYLITVGMIHTRNKRNYVLRLYLCCVAMGISNLLFKVLFDMKITGNIFPTLFYTAFFIFLLQNILSAVKNQKYSTSILYLTGVCFPFLCYLLYQFTHRGIVKIFSDLTSQNVFLIQDAVNAFFPNIITIEYSVLFVFIGVLFYFLKNRSAQCSMFFIMCVICFAGTTWAESYGAFSDFFMHNQYWMVLSIPFIWLYNGKKGNGHKNFFYIYYPAHQWILALASKIVAYI